MNPSVFDTIFCHNFSGVGSWGGEGGGGERGGEEQWAMALK